MIIFCVLLRVEGKRAGYTLEGGDTFKYGTIFD
jgi:hypothetical protein